MTNAIPDQGDFSARILAPVFRYVADRHGEDAVSALLGRAGLRASAREVGTWLTHAELEAALAAIRASLADDDEFRAACRHRVVSAYSPLSFVLKAASVASVYKLMARTIRLVSRVSTYEVADLGESRVWLRYTSPHRESRLMCLSRIAQITCLPELAGKPPAHLEERRCLSRGDPCCEYVMRW